MDANTRGCVDGADTGTFVEFWRERRLCTLASPRPDGSIHQVPVGATYDVERHLVRVICSASSYKARNLGARPGVRVSVSQVEGRRWCTVEGTATVRGEEEAVAEAERRYAERYRAPRPNPDRVVVEIAVSRVMGNVGTPFGGGGPGRP
ncbi:MULTISPECIES: pyridoxamine 5'-phosphate oxidase family protein [unclassified Nocardiopsis]|uniref:pyridoxamine 5'-phosphate oxidase family protein n=1 Tax=unclassified Nocardiopsis TaxID=2649073 RepID=UPI00135AB473|nr:MULTISPECIES: TIGR03618 family F420-dependent PPOX class oxidoreductase [unclassified Nocardiopsis]